MSTEISKPNGELIRRGNKWISPYAGNYVGRLTQELLRKEKQVTPREIAEMQYGNAFHKASAAMKLIMIAWCKWSAWRDYQALQDDGIRCYPCHDRAKRGWPIVLYKTWGNDKIDAEYWPIYRDRCRHAMERTARRYRTIMAAR